MIRRFLLARRITEPGCGRCGYAVRGLPGATCPECGADLAVVGILQPAPSRSREWGTLAWIVAWLAVVVTLARIGNDVLLRFTPGDVTNHRAYQLLPKSAQYSQVTLVRVGYGWGWPTDPWVPRAPTRSVMKLNRLTPAGEYFASELDVIEGGRYSYATTRMRPRPGTQVASVAASERTLDRQAVLEWMASMEVDVARDDVRAEAAELAQLVLAPDFAPAHHERINGFTVGSVTGGVEFRGSQPILVALWLVIGAAGVVLIVRLRRRRQRLPQSPSGTINGTLSAST